MRNIEFSCLRLRLASATDLGLEPSLDGIDGATRLARVAGDEVDTIVLAERSIGGFARLASDVFVCNHVRYQRNITVGKSLTNILSQDVFNLSLLEATLECKSRPIFTTSRTGCSHFGEHVCHDVLQRTVYPLANLSDVCEYCLLISVSLNRWRGDRQSLAS